MERGAQPAEKKKSYMSRRSTIEEMRKIAKKKGGKCLSKTYKNDRTKLTWQCGDGHIWQAIPTNVRRKAWCPHCYLESIKKEKPEIMYDTIYKESRRRTKLWSKEADTLVRKLKKKNIVFEKTKS